MSGLRIFPNGWNHLPCDAFNCNQSPTTYAIGVPDGPMGMHRRFCDADMQELIANLPDGLLPAVGALVIKHVQDGTAFGTDLWECFRALQPGTSTAGTASTGVNGEGGTATLVTISGGTGAAPDPAAHLAGIEAVVLGEVRAGTEWGQALVEKIAAALPDDAGSEGEHAQQVIQPGAGGNDHTYQLPGAIAAGVQRAIDEVAAAGGGVVFVHPVPDGHAVSQDATLLPPGTKFVGVPAATVEVAPDGAPDALTPLVPDAEGAPALTDGDGGEPPVNPEAEHACVCGWDPKPGSENPERDLKAHQRFCKVLKEQTSR